MPVRDGSPTVDGGLVVTFQAGDAYQIDALDARIRATGVKLPADFVVTPLQYVD